VSANQVKYPVRRMCRLLGVSPSGYYAWSRRASSQRAQADAELLKRIQAIYERSRGTYGSPRIQAELRACGELVSRKRVARLMRQAGLRGASRRRPILTTIRDEKSRPAPDLVKRHFAADCRDRLWVADITYIPTGAGFLYLAVVVDAWSRRIVGWSMATHLRWSWSWRP
jgi:putative transposase